MSNRTELDLISRIATQDSSRARVRARAIAEPLYRAQALAWAARYAPEADVLAVAREALTSSACAPEPYQQVAGAAWPIRALIERGLTDAAERAVRDTLRCAPMIENPVSRVDALFLLWQAVYPLGVSVCTRVAEPLLEAAVRADSWKPQRVLQSLVFMLPSSERQLADAIIDRMPAGKYKRGAARRLAAGEHQEPRPFFWRHAA